ncbi:hypothetical protein OG455_26065 [Kitasatospora sp. NBC_01287]|uniref:hypothetical protein n=1 Tax=Kitasatospora sp. NBC_01287 TaxID=2903573 RepID=UPI002258B89F|nr:hypothetical protein [Kitasatospora sp. NBC_01287]MCX4748940.1 hypothetical protein [Kitasatospora sp. NBC_01287]
MPGVLGAAGLDGAGSGVDQLLHSKIRAGGLPLPGQATAVPDAFALAGMLLPTVPPQARPAAGRQPDAPNGRAPSSTEAGGRAGRDVTTGRTPAAARGGEAAGDGVSGEPGPAPGGGGGTRADGASDSGLPAAGAVVGASGAHDVELAASRDGGRAGVGGAARPGGGAAVVVSGAEPASGGGPTTVGHPVAPGSAVAGPLAATGTEDAVLIPIAAGLLLTGAAMYKHRGLPRGH